MRKIIPIFMVAATTLVGCHTPSTVRTRTAAPTAAAIPSFHPMLISNFCTQTSLDGTWRIGVSDASVAVSRFPELTGEGWPARSKEGEATLSIPWSAHTGWLVFAENDDRVRAYDGDRLLILFTFSETWNKESWTSGGVAVVPSTAISAVRCLLKCLHACQNKHGKRFRIMDERPNERPGADAGWRVLFAFGRPRPRATQAGCSA